MPHNSYPSPEIENDNQNPEDLMEAFATAHETLRRIHNDNDFIQYRVNRHILSSHDPGYSKAIADYAHEYSEDFSPITEAVLATNDFIEAQNYLDRHPGHGQVDPSALDHVTYYGKILHRVIDEYPGIRPSQLFNHLIRATADANPHLRKQADYLLRSEIRGVQHERALKQLFTAEEVEQEGIHVEVEDSNVQNDLRGIDFQVTIQRPNKEPISVGVDAKASLSEIEAKYIDGEKKHGATSKHFSPNLPYWVNPHTGTVVMYSMVTDHEMGDSFTVPEHIVQTRALEAVRLLIVAAHEQPMQNRAV